MNIISSTTRLLLKNGLAKFYEAGFMLMRKDPKLTKEKLSAEGKLTEGLEDIFTYPDFVVKRLAECTAEATVEDARMNEILSGKVQLDSARITEKLAAKADVVSWFEKSRTADPLTTRSEQQMKRDGAILLSRKAAGYFEKGMFSQAEVFFSRAVEIDELHAESWSGLADALSALGQTDKADRVRARANSLLSGSD